MSAATARVYQPYFAGRVVPFEMQKSPQNKASTGIGVHILEKHIVSKIASC